MGLIWKLIEFFIRDGSEKKFHDLRVEFRAIENPMFITFHPVAKESDLNRNY